MACQVVVLQALHGAMSPLGITEVLRPPIKSSRSLFTVRVSAAPCQHCQQHRQHEQQGSNGAGGPCGGAARVRRLHSCVAE
jgi:hypothetical protein